METTIKQKWFYPAQAEVEEKLRAFYKEKQCSFQQVTKDRVTEFYNVIEAGGKMSQCVVTIFKISTSKKYRVMIYSCDFIASIN